MNERTLNNLVDTSTPVPPHFDDERTMLSARRVVPLEQINARVRNRRYWFLAGALAISMILGAASALVASYLKLRNVTTASNEAPQVEVTSAPVAVAESVPVPVESPVVEEPEPVPIESPESQKTEAAPKRRTAVAKHNEDLPAPRRTENMSEDEHLDRIREAVLYDEWQERRARRAERRERRRLDRYNHRDLSNLDEIFEGRRRRRANPIPY